MSLKIDTKNIVPIHDQIVAYFYGEISSGRLAKGEAMPSENALAKELGISRMTVRRAFDTLAFTGLLARHQGKGTFVSTRYSEPSEKGLIGFIGQNLTSGFSSECIAHLNGAIEQRNLAGWHLLVCSSDEQPDKMKRHIETFQEHGVRGVILTPLILEPYNKNLECLLILRQAKLPFVLMDRYLELLDSDYVVSDNFKASYIAAKHLIALGHKRIVLMQPGLAELPLTPQRENGYKVALEEHGLEFDPDLVLPWPRPFPLPDEQIYALLGKGVTAVYTSSDQAAMHLLKKCETLGIRVPQNLAVVGMGDLHNSWGPEPVLTTVRQDFAAMADKALDILLQRIHGHLDGTPFRHEILDVELVIRESCGAASPDRPMKPE